MPWVRLDDAFPESPKMLAVGPLGLALQVRALCYCSRNLTDGVISRHALGILTAGVRRSRVTIEVLLRERVWAEEGDGYVVLNYLDYQPSKAEIEQKRANARDRMAKARASRDSDVRANTSRTSREVTVTPSPPLPSPPVSSPDGEEKRQRQADALALFHTITGRKFRVLPPGAAARFRAGATLDDLKLVLEWLWMDRAGTQFEKHVCPETVFRPSKWDGYLAEATSWNKRGRPAKRSNDDDLSPEDQRRIDEGFGDYG